MIKKIKVKKKKLPLGAPQIAFQVMNTILIALILGFILYRGYTYKQLFDGQYSEYTDDTEKLLKDVLVERGITDVENFLSNEDGSYTYINSPKYNYVLYSGRLFRVLDINIEGEARMVSMTTEGLSNMVEAAHFSESSLYKWLNTVSGEEHSGIYVKSLEDYEALLINTKLCADRVTEAGLTNCKLSLSSSKATLLSFYDYVFMGGNESYVNNGFEYWLATNNSREQFWFISAQGAVSIGDQKTQYLSIRPVITLTSGTIVSSGNGTAGDPFVVYSPKKEKAIDLTVSNYVSYSGKIWRVVNKTSDGNVELLLNDYVKNDKDETIQQAFGTNLVYNVSSGVGKYLNTSFLNTLEDHQNVLVKNDWYYGTLKEADGYDYRGSFENSVNCYVGMPNISYMFLDTLPNIWLMNSVENSKEFVYVLDEYNHLYQQISTNKMNMRPLICVNGELAIAAGSGTMEDPFTFQVNVTQNGGDSNG